METPRLASENVATNVRLTRLKLGWSLEEVSDRLSMLEHRMSISALSKLETGSRGVSVDDLAALAAVLHVSPDELLQPPEAGDAGIALYVDRWVQSFGAFSGSATLLAKALERTTDAEGEYQRCLHSLQVQVRSELALHEGVGQQLSALPLDQPDRDFLVDDLARGPRRALLPHSLGQWSPPSLGSLETWCRAMQQL